MCAMGLTKVLDDIACEKVYVHAAFAMPSAEPDSVVSAWMALFEGLQGRALRQENHSGWHKSTNESDTGTQERLRAIVMQDDA